MQEDRKPDVLKRLSYIEGHVAGIRKMVEEDKYCVVGATLQHCRKSVAPFHSSNVSSAMTFVLKEWSCIELFILAECSLLLLQR